MTIIYHVSREATNPNFMQTKARGGNHVKRSKIKLKQWTK